MPIKWSILIQSISQAGKIASGLYGRQWAQGLLAGVVVGFPGGGSMRVGRVERRGSGLSAMRWKPYETR